MNQFLEAEELSYEDGVAVTEADLELRTAENDYNSFVHILELDSVRESSLEGYAFALATDTDTIKELVSLEEDDKFERAKNALIKFVKAIAKWVKTTMVKIYDALMNRSEKVIDELDDIDTKSLTKKEIDNAYDEDNRKEIDAALAKMNTTRLISRDLLNIFMEYNGDGFYASIQSEEGLVFENFETDTEKEYKFKENSYTDLESGRNTFYDVKAYMETLTDNLRRNVKEQASIDVKSPSDYRKLNELMVISKGMIKNNKILGNLLRELIKVIDAEYFLIKEVRGE